MKQNMGFFFLITRNIWHKCRRNNNFFLFVLIRLIEFKRFDVTNIWYLITNSIEQRKKENKTEKNIEILILHLLAGKT